MYVTINTMTLNTVTFLLSGKLMRISITTTNTGSLPSPEFLLFTLGMFHLLRRGKENAGGKNYIDTDWSAIKIGEVFLNSPLGLLI